MKKYELTQDTLTISSNITLHRIRALIDIDRGNGLPAIKAGDLGGWIESKENLSHDGCAWVHDDAQVCGSARVRDNAQVYGSARVYDSVFVRDGARIYDHARVSGLAGVLDHAKIYGNSQIDGRVLLQDSVQVFEDAKVLGQAIICGSALVHGSVVVNAGAVLTGDADVARADHYFVAGPLDHTARRATFFHNSEGGISVKYGCFIGSVEQYLDEVSRYERDERFAPVRGYAEVHRQAAAAATSYIRAADKLGPLSPFVGKMIF